MPPSPLPGREGGEPVRPSAANGPERSEGARGKLSESGEGLFSAFAGGSQRTARTEALREAINPLTKIAPSILSADFMRLGEQVRETEAAAVDRVQVDVMDGRFVPNITFGADALAALRPVTRLLLEAHLMVTPPEDFIESMARAGADTIIVHQESTPHLHRAIQHIHALGKTAGVALNPSTPAILLSEVLESLQLVLVMTVNPGFGGQEFIPGTLRKVQQVRGWIREHHLDCEVEVDGGINLETAPRAVEAGANILVAGTAVFDHPAGIGPAIEELLAACGPAAMPD